MHLTVKLKPFYLLVVLLPGTTLVADSYLDLRPPVYRELATEPEEWINPFLRPTGKDIGGLREDADPLDRRVEALARLERIVWGAHLVPNGEFGGLVIANRRIVRLGERIREGDWEFEILSIGRAGLDLRVVGPGKEPWDLEGWEYPASGGAK